MILAAAQAVPWILCAVMDRSLVSVRISRPTAFGLAVYLATLTPALFPWTPAGAMAPWVSLIQPAEIIGERGVSALIGFGAATLAVGLRQLRFGNVRGVADAVPRWAGP